MSSSAFTPSVLTIAASGSSGSGSGEINTITNNSAVTDASGWTNATRVTSNSPLNPVISTAFAIANTATSESSTSGGYTTFTLPTGLQNKKLKVEFYFTTPATDVYRVSVYKSTTRVPLSTDSSSVTTLPASTTGKFTAYFDTDTTSGWTLSITRISGSTGTCYITQVIVGPGIQPQGAVVGEWQSYTPTISGMGTGTAAATGRYRRVGDSLQASFNMLVSISGTGSSEIVLTLPTGLTIDVTKLPFNSVTNSNNVFGFYTHYDGSIFEASNGIFGASSTSIRFLESGAAGTLTGADFSSTSASLEGMFTVPIAEWAGSGTVNLAQNDVEWVYPTGTVDADSASDGSATGYGPQGATWGAMTDIRNKYVRWQTPPQNGDVISIEVSRDSGVSWSETSAPWAGNATSTSTAGAKFISTTSGVTRFQVGRYAEVNPTAWLSSDRIRFKKSSAGAAVGFGIVVPGVSSGLVSASGLPGNTTGSAIASGYVGQVISFTTRTVTVGGTGTWYAQATEMGTLTAGVWLINAFYNCPCINATNAVSVAGVATSSSAGTGLQSQTAFSAYGSDTGKAVSGPCVSFVYSTSSSQNIYAQFYSYNSAAVSPTVGGYAIRIA